MDSIRRHSSLRGGSRGPASEYVELAQQIRELGLLRRRYGYYWTKLIAVPVAYLACLALFMWVGDSWWQLAVAVLVAFVFTQTAFLGHDAAHRQIFRSGKWNDWVSLIIGDLFIGMSYGWWQHKHTRHHANPNKEGADPDIELPIVAFTPAQMASHRRALGRWAIAHQGWFFFPILTLEGLSLHASSVRQVFGRRHVERRSWEIGFLTVRLGGYLALVFLVLSPGIAAAFLATQLGLFGFYLGMSFAPNHKGMPIVRNDLRLGFLPKQVMMSRNIRGNWAVDFIMGGLNYQIEHHLFPSMARPQLRKAAPLVAEFCRAKDVPYLETGFWRSYAIVAKYLNSVGLADRDPFVCPLLAERMALGCEPGGAASKSTTGPVRSTAPAVRRPPHPGRE